MKCKNSFLENDGFCTECGTNHLDNQVKRSASKLEKSHARAGIRRNTVRSSVVRSIPNSGAETAARDTIKMLAELFDLDIEVITGGRKSSCARMLDYGLDRSTDKFIPNSNKFQIVLSEKSLLYRSASGHHEYRSIEWILYPYSNEELSGRNAGIWVAMHEVAHCLSNARHGRQRGVSHGANFANTYLEIIDLVMPTKKM